MNFCGGYTEKRKGVSHVGIGWDDLFCAGLHSGSGYNDIAGSRKKVNGGAA